MWGKFFYDESPAKSVLILLQKMVCRMKNESRVKIWNLYICFKWLLYSPVCSTWLQCDLYCMHIHTWVVKSGHSVENHINSLNGQKFENHTQTQIIFLIFQ